MSCSRQQWKLVEDKERWLNISQATLLYSNIWTLFCSTFPHCALISAHLQELSYNLSHGMKHIQWFFSLSNNFSIVNLQNLLISFWESKNLCTGATDLNLFELKPLEYVIWATYIFSFRTHVFVHINFEGCKDLTNVSFSQKNPFSNKCDTCGVLQNTSMSSRAPREENTSVCP